MGMCFSKLDADKEFEKHYQEELQRRLGRQISNGPLYAPPQLAQQQGGGPPQQPGGPPPLQRVTPWAGPALPFGQVDIPVPTDAPPVAATDSDAFWVPKRRKALLIGINYFQTPQLRLQGCINDAHCMRYLLTTHFGFPAENIVMLTDDATHPDYYPSRANIARACHWLEGDSLFFSFSGHGKEVDGLNSTIVPADYRQSGQMIDDELNALLVQPLRTGARLHALVDACHSATAIDLPLIARIRPDGWAFWEDERLKPRRPAQLTGTIQAGRVAIPRSFSYRGPQGGEAVMFSGSADNQTSADTRLLSGYASTGACTFCFIQAIQNGQGATYNMLFRCPS
eukprot:scaffold5.g996.t1